MKKFKDLYKNLEENMNDYPPGFSDGSDKRTVGGDSFGAFRVGEGNTISRINAFINKYLIGSYLPGDYKLALRELRVRLNHIGLDFDSEKELENSTGLTGFYKEKTDTPRSLKDSKEKRGLT